MHMLNAFKQLGYEVEVVAGHAQERIYAIGRIKKAVREGKEVDFIYSESSTLPTLLTEPHRFPTHPSLDFGFFRWAKRRGIPIGLYYRDVYWRFGLYRERFYWAKRIVGLLFYYFDWWQYTRFVDYLFIPSFMMKSALPGAWPEDRLTALSPGCEIYDFPSTRTGTSPLKKLRLLYVGGIAPPLYDLFEMVSVVSTLSRVELTLICRKEEWDRFKDYYGLHGNIKVLHVSGEELKEHYFSADLFIFVRAPYPYLEFAMPVKLFEALGFGLPIITNSGTAAGQFVEEEDVGWVVSSARELRVLLAGLLADRHMVEEKRARVKMVRGRHTWLARASKVASILNTRNAKVKT